MTPQQMARNGTRPMPEDCQTPDRLHWIDRIQRWDTPIFNRSRQTEEHLDRREETLWTERARLLRLCGWVFLAFAAVFILWRLML